MKTRVCFVAFVAILVVVVTGCGDPPNHLEGSIADAEELQFDSTRLIRYPSMSIQLEYIKELEGSETPNIVAKIVFDTPEGGIPQGEPVDLAEANAIVERIVAGGEGWPAFESGRITFDEGGNDPGPAVGTFAITFADNGRTLNGNFDVDMEDVDI